VQVIVTEGKVAVSSVGNPETTTIEGPKSELLETIATLVAGEEVTIEEEIASVEVLDDSEIDTRLSWRNGLLTFYGEPLSEVINDVSRYTRFEIVVEDPSLADKRFGGVFKIGNVDSLFEAIERSLDVQVVRVGDTVYVRAEG